MHGPVTQEPCCFGECCRRLCGGEPRGSRTGGPLENLARVRGHRPMNFEGMHEGSSSVRLAHRELGFDQGVLPRMHPPASVDSLFKGKPTLYVTTQQ